MTDYQRIEKAIMYVTQRVGQQPTLDEIADHIQLSPYHFQRLFSHWAGVSPKRFLQLLTVERAKQLLNEARPQLEVSDSLGLSSGSRLYDHFINLEAMTPGEYKSRGKGMTIEYAVHDTPFGPAFIATTRRGICKFSFLGQNGIEGEMQDLLKQWSEAEILNTNRHTSDLITTMFQLNRQADRPLSLLVRGTNFQVSVWKSLMQIPPARVTSYSRVANALGRPGAARAIGRAVAINPVAFLIPCHRVIRQTGQLAGYHWGEARKHAIHAWESARYG
ncbi:MAG: methylated-DNA--[protein]-cysteine S-methyltransferase [Gammaproteobacteria bacterium]